MMVSHIFKKDWLLLWPIVTALTVLQVLLAVARFSAGHFLNGVPTVPLSLLQLVAAATVIVLVVHQDPIPGIRQDWLVRPIKRRDLFLAKLLFVVVLVQGPWFVTDLLQGLANGFPLGESMAAATASALWVLLTLTLPVLAFAALTSTMTETFVAALGVFVVIIAFLAVPGLVGAAKPTAQSGFAWVPSFMRSVLMLGAAAGVSILQYRWRRRWAASALFAVALLAGQTAPFLPWRATFRLDQLLAAGSSDAPDIAVAFAPGEGKFRLTPGQGIDDVLERPGFGPVDVAAENQRRRAAGARTVFLPLRVSGLISDSRLLADRTEVRLIGPEGRVEYEGRGNRLEIRATDADATIHQGVRVPGEVYSRIEADRLDVQLDYHFTLFEVDGRYGLPALNGDLRMPGIGWCATRVDAAGTRVLFRCLQPGERPSCMAVTLEHTPTGQHNPEVSFCVPNYTPIPGHTLPDAIARFGGRLPFYDPSGLVRYPVGEAELSETRVVVTNFRPTVHFIRRVVIRGVRLRDWEAQGTANAGVSP